MCRAITPLLFVDAAAVFHVSKQLFTLTLPIFKMNKPTIQFAYSNVFLSILGILTDDPIHPRRKDVDAERVLYFESIDEGLSLLTHKNLDRCGNPALCHDLFDNGDDEAFQVTIGQLHKQFLLDSNWVVGLLKPAWSASGPS